MHIDRKLLKKRFKFDRLYLMPGQICNPVCNISGIPPCLTTPFVNCDKLSVSSCVTFQSRRTTHISAEQKRRSNINIGFKTLCNLVPTLKSQSNVSYPCFFIKHHYFWLFLFTIFAACVLNI